MNPLFQATKYAEEDLEPLIGYSQMLRVQGNAPGTPPQVKKMAMWVSEIQNALSKGVYQFQDGKGRQVAVVHRSTQINREGFPWQVSYFWPHKDGIPEAVGHDSCKDLRGVLLSLTENDTVLPSTLLGSSLIASALIASDSSPKTPYYQKVISNPAFQAWFGDSKVVDAQGQPLLVFHGTLSEFKEFSPKHSEAEAWWGPGFYFTTNPNDASENYGSQDGPDQNFKIERFAEDLENDKDRLQDIIVEQFKKIGIPQEQWDLDDDGEFWSLAFKAYNIPVFGNNTMHILCRKVAKQQLFTHEGAVVLAFLRCSRPLMGALEFEPSDLNPSEDQEEDGGFIEEVSQGGQEIIDTLTFYGVIDGFFDEFLDNFEEGYIRVSDLRHFIASHQNYEPDAGSPGRIVAEIARNLGYDGIKQLNPAGDYSGMRNVGHGTNHWIVFDPKQIKAFYNKGTWDKDSAVLNQGAKTRRFGQAIQSLTIHELRDAEDRQFVHKEEHRRELEPPVLEKCYASTVTYLTKSSKFQQNKLIYQQKVLFKDFVYIAKDKSIPFEEAIRYSIEHGDVHSFCPCKSQSFFGWNWIAKGLDYLYGLPNPRDQKQPKIRNPKLKSVYCKHLSRVMEKILEDEELLIKKFAEVYNRSDLLKALPNTQETKEFAPEGPAAAANNPPGPVGDEMVPEAKPPKPTKYDPLATKGSPFRGNRAGRRGPYGMGF